jgi:hypothetical protein
MPHPAVPVLHEPAHTSCCPSAEDIQVPLNNKSWIGSLSAGTEVYEIVFRETDGAYDLDWHTAPCRQFIIMIDGE